MGSDLGVCASNRCIIRYFNRYAIVFFSAQKGCFFPPKQSELTLTLLFKRSLDPAHMSALQFRYCNHSGKLIGV